MDFFDNVKNAVESAAQTVVKKSGEAIEYSKIKYSMYDTTNSVKSLYSKIGEAVYKSYKSGSPLDEDIKDLCAEIDALGVKLDDLADQLGGIRASVKCPSCGKNVKDECTYCPYCGGKLAHDVDAHIDIDINIDTDAAEEEADSNDAAGE